jgi:uncharacterized protein (DUF952 family)
MGVIYHIATRSIWDAALENGVYAPATLASDGFIHCSSADQYVDVANALFAGCTDLVLLFIDTDHLAPELRLESTSPAGPRYPHLYGPLNTDAVFEVADYKPGPTGKFEPHHETGGLVARGEEGLDEAKRRALEAMATFDRPWWIAGGWALDIFLGRKTRPHADLEISIMASDLRALFDHLQGWDLRLAAPEGSFPRWDGRPLVGPYHQVWARRGPGSASTPEEFGDDPTMLDFLVEAGDGELWRYRRHDHVSRPVTEFGDIRDGVPFVRPEVALLFKAKQTRFKDQRDFERVFPRLDVDARKWLLWALRAVHPRHHWYLTRSAEAG